MYRHFPSPPPWLTGNWHVTANVWHNCVLPVRNSPKTSVIDPVSMPPPSNLSNSREPLVSWMISERFWWNSVAVVNPIGTNFAASAIILSALPSEIPLIVLTKCQKKNYRNFLVFCASQKSHLQQMLLWRKRYRLDRMISSLLQFFNVSTCDAIDLQMEKNK